MRENDRLNSGGFWDGLFAGIRNAIADIRHKVVEEGWFGRAVTREPRKAHDDFYRPILPERATSFEEQWAPGEAGTVDRDRGQERHGPGIDL
jgi:hypothetical protein